MVYYQCRNLQLYYCGHCGLWYYNAGKSTNADDIHNICLIEEMVPSSLVNELS